MAYALSMMSSIRRAGFSEGKGAIPIDLLLEARFAHGLFGHVRFAAEKFGQKVFEIIQAADVVETRRGDPVRAPSRRV